MVEALSLKKGAPAAYKETSVVIDKSVGTDEVLVRLPDGAFESVRVADLEPCERGNEAAARPIEAYGDDELDVARDWKAVIEPLLAIRGSKAEKVKELAAEYGVSKQTIYRKFKTYKETGRLSSLAPKKRKRKKRLDPRVEAIITSIREELYLNTRRVTVTFANDEIRRRCRAAKLKPPHANTVRSRFKVLEAKEVTKRREGRKVARDRHEEVLAEYPDAEAPLSSVQIDHTPLNLQVLDDDRTVAIGRPWLTLAIDVFSRMVVGYHLSLDKPNAFSVGLCLLQSFLPKERLLEDMGVEAKWPVWSFPRMLHTDNGKEFRGTMIGRACEEYGITLAHRPGRTPHYGGHVERLMNTVSSEINNYPGTTKSNVRDKGEYDPEAEAVLTFHEVELAIMHWITGVYHNRLHKRLGKSPLARWEDGILGRNGCRGTGMPDRLQDNKKLRLDFLPYQERVVSREGVVWDNIHYFTPALGRWIGEKQDGKSIKHVFRRDPRDISYLYFWDPETQVYVDVPYRDQWRPSMSLWDLRAIQKHLKREGVRSIDEKAIFGARDNIHEIVENATKATKKAKAEKQKRKNRTKSLAKSKRETEPKRSHLTVVSDTTQPCAPECSTPEDDDQEFDIPDDELVPDYEEL